MFQYLYYEFNIEKKNGKQMYEKAYRLCQIVETVRLKSIQQIYKENDVDRGFK